MNTAENNMWHFEAGEYVLGTLRGDERDLFEKVLERDFDARDQVAYWEQKLSTLEQTLQNQEAKSDQPPALPTSVWDNIAGSLDQVEQKSPDIGLDNSLSSVSRTAATVRAPVSGELVPPTIKLRRWRGLAVVSLAASLALGAFLLKQQFLDLASPPTFQSEPAVVQQSGGVAGVSILSSEDGTNLWAIFADAETGVIRAAALQAPEESPDNSHQLWILLPDDAGVQSVGLLPYGSGNATAFTLPEDADRPGLVTGASFAVSLEPAGGTTSSVPTGPVISVREYIEINEGI